MSDEELQYSVQCSLGDLSLEVRGPDEEWVEDRFETLWADRLGEAAEMKQAIRTGDMSAQ